MNDNPRAEPHFLALKLSDEPQPSSYCRSKQSPDNPFRNCFFPWHYKPLCQQTTTAKSNLIASQKSIIMDLLLIRMFPSIQRATKQNGNKAHKSHFPDRMKTSSVSSWRLFAGGGRGKCPSQYRPTKPARSTLLR